MNLFYLKTCSFQIKILIDVIIKRMFNILLNLPRKGMVQKNIFWGEFYWEKNILCSKWSNSSRKSIQMLKFVWLVGDKWALDKSIHFLIIFWNLPIAYSYYFHANLIFLSLNHLFPHYCVIFRRSHPVFCVCGILKLVQKWHTEYYIKIKVQKKYISWERFQ